MPTASVYGPGFNQLARTLYPDPAQRHAYSEWSGADTRWLRYYYLWSFYDQSIYWGALGDALKRETGSYRNIRPVLNRIRQIVEFDVSHVLGGRLDNWAGDGKMTPSALPIILAEGADKSLNGSIAKLWRDSRWQQKKSLFSRLGASLGDFGLELIDDASQRQIQMRVIHPAEIRAMHRDSAGRIDSITLERIEIDPEDRNGQQLATYKEVVARNPRSGVVHYETFKDDAAYRWPGTRGQQWDSPFPFIPVAIGQHIDQGFPWGLSEISGAIGKSIELDDQGSLVGDSVRRMTAGPWLLSGATINQRDKNRSPYYGDPFDPNGGREESVLTFRSAQISSRQEMSIVECASENAKMTPLVYPLPVSEVVGFIAKIGESLEQEYPELQVDLAQASGSASGRALRVARQKSSTKIEERRSGYDEVICHAHRYACVMGGMLGYKGYETFNRDSIEDGRLDHQIGERPVFGNDPLDSIEIQQARMLSVKTAREAGFPFVAALEIHDFEPEAIERIVKQADEETAKLQRAESDRMDAALVSAPDEDEPDPGEVDPGDPVIADDGTVAE